MPTTSTIATADARRPHVEGLVPERALLGLVLLVIGTIMAVGFVFEGADRFSLIGVSLTTLVAFAVSREYGYAIPAGITGGIGTAVLALSAGTFGPALTPAVLFLSVAGGFLAVWVLGLMARPREVHPWPLVPAVILGALGGMFAAGQPDLVGWVQVAIAAGLVLAGGTLVTRRGDA